MMTQNRIFDFARRSLALSALLAASFAAAHAQQASTSAVTPTSAEPALNLQLPAADKSNTFSSSSSTADSDSAAVANLENPFDAFVSNDKQPPPRRGYNRPRYRGGNTNADGSNKYAFLAGAGLTQPIGNTYHYLTPSWGIQVGGGRNFDKNFGLIAQFDYDNFGFTGRTISNQSYIYFGTQGQGLDGSSHVWSLTLNPTYTISSGEGLGAYVVGGVGFYHKTANFTVPATGQYCDPFYGICYQYAAQQTIDKYTSNAPGFNGGFGLTYKLSRFSNERFYVEARYVYVANKQRFGYTAANVASAPLTATNFYPANSNRTTYIPIKVGIRF